MKGRSSPLMAVADLEPDQNCSLQPRDAGVRERLRAPQLEALLVDVFDEPTYFAILATAFERLHRRRSAPAVDGVSAELAAASLILTGANFEGFSARSRPRNLLTELSDYSGHSCKQIVGAMASSERLLYSYGCRPWFSIVPCSRPASGSMQR